MKSWFRDWVLQGLAFSLLVKFQQKKKKKLKNWNCENEVVFGEAGFFNCQILLKKNNVKLPDFYH
jgi:hypothetical protein